MVKGIVLTIDLSDPCGGGGINAAIKTIHELGGYAQTAITCVTARTPDQMLSFHPIPAHVVMEQVRAAFSSFPVDSIVVGLLPNKGVIDAVGDFLDGLAPEIQIVVDPVIGSRDGKRFLEKVDVDALKRRILLHADLLLPNVSEAEILTGLAIRDAETMEHAAEMLVTLGPRNVFLKGDGLMEEKIHDIYVDDRRTQVFESERVVSTRTHGAGTTLAAAAAVQIAQGSTPRQSVTHARNYVEEAIRNAPVLGHDYGPVGHFIR